MFALLMTTCLLGFVVYWWYNVLTTRYKLRWLPTVPGLPILGNVMDFLRTTQYINSFHRYTSNNNGLCRTEFFTFSKIVATDHKFLEFLLTTTQILDKSIEYEHLKNWLGTGLITAPGNKWKIRRKLITPTFHFGILEQFVDVFESNTNIMIELLEKECTEKLVDIYPYINMCTLDIICEAAMGVSINAQRTRQSEYISAVKEVCRIIIERGNNFFRRTDLTYPLTKDYYKEKKSIKILHSHTNSVIKAKQEELNNNRDNGKENIDEGFGVKKKMAFLDLLLQCRVDGKPLSHEDIREEVDTFMFAGHDTTTSGITFVLYNIAKYQDIQDRLIDEQKLLFGPDRDKTVTHRDLQEMKYLENVIKESIRLYPPVPYIGKNTDKEVEYEDNKVIPKGVDIIVFIYGANRNPNYFENPDIFDPNRFENIDGKLPYAYIPFSAGPRNCIGQKFAMLEMKSIVSKVLRHFELFPAGPDFEPIIATEAVLRSKNGINIKLKKRQW